MIFPRPVLKLLIPIMLMTLSAGFAVAGDKPSYTIQVRQSGTDRLQVNIHFEEPGLAQQDGYTLASYEQAQLTVDRNGAVVPVITRLVPFPHRNARLIVGGSEFSTTPVKDYLIQDQAGNSHVLAELTYQGLYRDIPMHALRIYPVSVNPEAQILTWLKSLELEVIPVSTELPDGAAVKTKTLTQLNPVLLDQSIQTVTAAVENIPDLNVHRIPLEHETAFRLVVDETGLYKVTYEELEEAGFPVNEVDPRKLRLFNKGKEIPVYFRGAENGSFEAGEFLEFWGERNEQTFTDKFPDVYEDPFSDENTYWLTVSQTNGERLVEESGGLRETQPGFYRTPYSFTEKVHFEQNNYYAILGRIDSKLHKPAYETDHWFYDNGVSAVGSRSYDFDLPYPVDYGSQVFVKAMFRGASYRAPANPLRGHQVALWLNDQKVGEIYPEDGWEDQEYAVINNTGGTGIAQTNLRHGTNQLLVQMDQAGVTDIVLLNWFEVTYQREYRAHQNFIRFRLQNNFPTDRIIQFEVRGFSSRDIQVYKLGVSKIINATIEYAIDDTKQPNTYKVKIQDQIIDPGTEYVALTESSKKQVKSIAPYRPWKPDSPERNILQTSNRADYLIITHNLFETSAQELKNLKEAAGYTVEIVTVEQIYDLFNYGHKSPIAIRNFIRHVYYSWGQDTPLEYVVLVGDASYDHKDYRRSGSDLVPTLMFETYNYGASASDYWYSLISGDDMIPDIIVSRIPVRTNQQLLDYIVKIDQYQNTAPVDDWRNSTLFISGNDDPSKSGNLENITGDPVFRAQSLRLITMQLPTELFAARLNTVRDTSYTGGFDPEFGGKTDLIDYFNDGLSFINFLGHGGGGIWADVNLLDLEDVGRLNNEAQYPFIASMTCFTGAFENPGKDGLAERLVLAENRGAIAVLASSGLGWMQNDYTIEWGLFDYLWKDGVSFGEAVNLMKIFYMINPIYITEEKSFFTWGYNSLVPSMVYQYNLLGDPALYMQKPAEKLDINLNTHTPYPGETVSVSVADVPANASGRIEISDRNNRNIVSAPVSAGSGPLYEFVVPEETEGELYRIKVYLENGQTDASGMAQIGVSKSLVKEVTFTPAEPDVNQPVDIEIVVGSAEPIAGIRCIDFRDFNTTRAHNFEIAMTRVSDTLFQSVDPVPGFKNDGLKYFDIEITTETDSVYLFSWRKLYVGDSRPDVEIDAESVVYSGDIQLNLEFKVLNNSGEALENVAVKAVETYTSGSEEVIYENELTLPGNSEHIVTVPIGNRGLVPHRRFTLTADPESEISERDEHNNTVEKILFTDRVLIERETGTSPDGSSNDTLLIAEQWGLYIAPQGVTATTVMNFENRDIKLNLERGKQKDLRFIPNRDGSDTTALVLKVRNETTDFSNPATISAYINRSLYSGDILNTISFFKYDSYLGLWVAVPSSWSGNRLTAAVTSDGMYAVFSFSDEEEPTIEITVDGRPLLSDMLVTSNPAMAFLLQDANGINLSGSFRLLIDGRELSEDEMTYPDSIRNANTISILTTPELSEGDHSLQVQVRDVSGNRTEQNVTFSVSGEFDIRVFGNYPNPFRDETIISYFINSTQPIDEFTIKIYSTSGRLVRSEPLIFDESITDDLITAPNYHELIWDGTDDDGNLVANGVYFAVIKGTFQGETVEHTIKMAKLK